MCQKKKKPTHKFKLSKRKTSNFRLYFNCKLVVNSTINTYYISYILSLYLKEENTEKARNA